MKRFASIAATALLIAGSLIAATRTADAAVPVPSGCGTAHEINRKAMIYGVGSSTWRVGTLVQYWGWCNSVKRNWAYAHLWAGYSQLDLKIAIQTRDGVLHGARTPSNAKNLLSAPANTMCCSTRARISGNFWDNGGVATLGTVVTAWT